MTKLMQFWRKGAVATLASLATGVAQAADGPVLNSGDTAFVVVCSLVVLLMWIYFSSAILLFSATYLYKVLGMRVLTAVERLMGMLLGEKLWPMGRHLVGTWFS